VLPPPLAVAYPPEFTGGTDHGKDNQNPGLKIAVQNQAQGLVAYRLFYS
jgi:hypothetical protein